MDAPPSAQVLEDEAGQLERVKGIESITFFQPPA